MNRIDRILLIAGFLDSGESRNDGNETTQIATLPMPVAVSPFTSTGYANSGGSGSLAAVYFYTLSHDKLGVFAA